MPIWILTTLLALGGVTFKDGERALDTLVLANGDTVEGHVLFEGAETITFREGSKRREIPKAEVSEIQSVSRSLRMLLDQYAHVDSADPRQMLDLARFARSRKLDGLAEVFALRALVSAPDDEDAHEFLGHKRRGKDDWSVRAGKRKVKYSKLAEERSDWKNAWEVRTPHYEIKTNLDLSVAVDVAMDLELFYREFYDRFGGELGLHEVVERMPASVYANSKEFPEIGSRVAYFNPADMTTYVNAERGYIRDIIFHEATHQLLYATAVSPVHSAESKGCLPAWLDEGLACWYQTVQAGPPGRVTFEYRKRWRHYMVVHGSTEKPYAFSRVLTFGADDFHASSRVDLKYAQAYTLVEFFQTGDFYRHREAFFKILKQAYDGDCTAQDVKSTLEMSADDFEAAWTAFVRE